MNGATFFLTSFLALLVLGCALRSGDSTAGDAFTPARADAVAKTDAEWRTDLDALEYRILRQKGTEPAFTGKYWDSKDHGVYRCAGCGLPLFASRAKFESGTGWPSFHSALAEDRLGEQVDNKFGMARTEILCNRCGGHLGHVFADGPAPTGLRYCVNGAALDFTASE